MTLKKQKEDITVQLPALSKILPEKFIPVLKDQSKYLVLWGGRASGKSYTAAFKVIYMMLTSKHFKCICIRQTLEASIASQYESLQKIVEDFGLGELFTFKVKPREIICTNGNKVIFRGLDKPGRIKSLSEYTMIWHEEEFPTNYNDAVKVWTTLRSKKGDYLQVMFSINPEVEEGAYQDNWFWQKFFGNAGTEKTYRTRTLIDLGNGKQTEETVFVHHSTHEDNPHLPDSARADLIGLKNTEPQKYINYCLGLWANKTREGLFYGKFNRAVNVVPIREYDPTKPLHFSIDENLMPYMAGVLFQFNEDKTQLYAIDELKGTHPNNNVRGICSVFKDRYKTHTAGLYVYGDVSLRKRSTATEADYNGLRTIETELGFYRPVFRIPTLNPSVKNRADFINALFAGQIPGCSLYVVEACKQLITDLMDVQQDYKDGTKVKSTVRRNGETYQRIAHMSDAMDYALCQLFENEFYEFIYGGRSYKPIVGREPFRKTHGY